MAYIIIISLLIGIVIGFILPINIPSTYVSYLSVAILAALDSVFGGIRASLEEKFDNLIFITGFFWQCDIGRRPCLYWGCIRSSHLSCGNFCIWKQAICQFCIYKEISDRQDAEKIAVS